MKGTRFDMDLSYVLREPIKTRIKLFAQNPSIPISIEDVIDVLVKLKVAKDALAPWLR